MPDSTLANPNDLVDKITRDDLADIADIAGSEKKPGDSLSEKQQVQDAEGAGDDLAKQASSPDPDKTPSEDGKVDFLGGLGDLLETGDGAESTEKSTDDLSENEKIALSTIPEKQREAFISQRQEISALKKENDTLKKSGGGDAVLLQSRLTDMEARLASYEVVNMQEFHEKFDNKINDEVRRAAGTIAKLGGKAEDALKVAKMSLRNRFDHIQQNYGDAGSLLHPAFAEIDRLMDDRQVAISDAQNTMRTMRADRSAGIARGVDNIDNTVEALVEKSHFLLKKNDNSDWNAKVDARIASAKNMSKELATDSANILLKATLADEYLALISVLVTQRTQYVEKFGRLRRSAPDLGAGGRGDSASSREAAGSKGRTPEEVASMLGSGMPGR